MTNSKPKAYAYVVPDQQLHQETAVPVEAFDKIRQKRQQKKQKIIRTIRNITLVLIGGTVFFTSPLANIATINVSGNQQVNEQFIIDNSQLAVGQNFYWLNPWAIIQKLEEQPLIKEAKISRHFGNEVEITVTETPVMGLTQIENERRWILATGELVAVQNDIRLNVPYFRNWDEQHGQLLLENLQKIPDDVRRQISEVAFNGNETDPEQLQLYMRDGNQVTISIRQIPDKFGFYFAIVEALGNKRMHIHLEAGNYAIPL